MYILSIYYCNLILITSIIIFLQGMSSIALTSKDANKHKPSEAEYLHITPIKQELIKDKIINKDRNEFEHEHSLVDISETSHHISRNTSIVNSLSENTIVNRDKSVPVTKTEIRLGTLPTHVYIDGYWIDLNQNNQNKNDNIDVHKSNNPLVDPGQLPILERSKPNPKYHHTNILPSSSLSSSSSSATSSSLSPPPPLSTSSSSTSSSSSSSSSSSFSFVPFILNHIKRPNDLVYLSKFWFEKKN